MDRLSPEQTVPDTLEEEEEEEEEERKLGGETVEEVSGAQEPSDDREDTPVTSLYTSEAAGASHRTHETMGETETKYCTSSQSVRSVRDVDLNGTSPTNSESVSQGRQGTLTATTAAQSTTSMSASFRTDTLPPPDSSNKSTHLSSEKETKQHAAGDDMAVSSRGNIGKFVSRGMLTEVRMWIFVPQ